MENATGMMSSKLISFTFSQEDVAEGKMHEISHIDLPVVYVIYDGPNRAPLSSGQRRDVYIGESLNAARRLRQHLETPAKQHLRNVLVIFNDTFNKSVCLDLES